MIRRLVIALLVLVSAPFLKELFRQEVAGFEFGRFLYPAIFFLLVTGLNFPSILACAAIAGLVWDIESFLPSAAMGESSEVISGRGFLGVSMLSLAILGGLMLRLLKYPWCRQWWLLPLWAFFATLCFAGLDSASFIFFYSSALPTWHELQQGFVHVLLSTLVASPVLFVFYEGEKKRRKRYLPQPSQESLVES